MSLLNYLIAFSIILLSAAKSADIFMTSDKALTKIQNEFIQKTRKLHKNERGNISLVAALITLILSFLLMFYLTKMKLEFKEAQYRKKSYLCFHYLNVETNNYINEMAKFNVALKAAFAARKTVVNGIEGEALFRSLVILRNTRHFLYLKKLTQNQFCHAPETLSYLQSTPFKIKASGILETNIDETAIVRQNQWTYLYYKNPSGIRLKKSFCLKSDFQIEGAFLPNVKVQTSEIAIAELSNLKCFYGSS